MPTKRPYDQFCPIATALDVVGDRWNLLLVRELFVGPVRYRDLLASLHPISTDVLATRLRDLETTGLLVHDDDGTYDLTADGRALAPVLRALGGWGAGRLRPPHKPADLTAARALQLLAITNAETSGDGRVVAVHTDDLVVTIVAGPAGWVVRRTSDPAVDASVTLADETLWRLVTADLTWQEALDCGAVSVEGDGGAVEAVLAGSIPAELGLTLAGR